jgi:hypothetical protein
VITHVAITDPHHPLYGRRFELISLASLHDPGSVTIALEDGRCRSVRRAATDLDPAPAPRPGPDVPRISVRTLLPLAHYVRGLLSTCDEEVRDGPRHPSGASPRGAGDDRSDGITHPTRVAGADAGDPGAAGTAARPAALPDADPAPRPAAEGGGRC